jgi:hypothetical protein
MDLSAVSPEFADYCAVDGTECSLAIYGNIVGAHGAQESRFHTSTLACILRSPLADLVRPPAAGVVFDRCRHRAAWVVDRHLGSLLPVPDQRSSPNLHRNRARARRDQLTCVAVLSLVAVAVAAGPVKP